MLSNDTTIGEISQDKRERAILTSKKGSLAQIMAVLTQGFVNEIALPDSETAARLTELEKLWDSIEINFSESNYQKLDKDAQNKFLNQQFKQFCFLMIYGFLCKNKARLILGKKK